MHVLPRPQLPRPAGVAMAAILAIVITIVLLAAFRSVGSASAGGPAPAARVAPVQAPGTTSTVGSDLHVLAPSALSWPSSPIPSTPVTKF